MRSQTATNSFEENFSPQDQDGYPDWPRINQIGLSTRAKRDRLLGIGGSDANIIMAGDDARLHALWLEKRGDAPSADLSQNLAVMLGSWTESFNRQWYELNAGHNVSDVGLLAVSPTCDWRRATLDGLVMTKSSVWEAKHVNAFAKPEQVLARYMPQLQHNMAVLELDNAILSVIYGNHKWEVYEVASDWLYQEDLLAAETRFWEAVRRGISPVASAPLTPPKPVAVREVCLVGNNAWAVAAADWIDYREAARRHAEACRTLKSLVEQDVSRAFGHGVEAKRSKAGAITIGESRA